MMFSIIDNYNPANQSKKFHIQKYVNICVIDILIFTLEYS
jgi:hypothetical protein